MTGLSFTIASFSGGQNKARLWLWKAILFSSTTLFILLILHLHIHYELGKIQVPKRPSKAAAISLLLRESLDPSASLMKRGKHTSRQMSAPVLQSSHRTPEQAQLKAAISCWQHTKRSHHDENSFFPANHSEQFSEEIPVLIIAVWELPWCSHWVTWSKHLNWTPFSSIHLDRTSGLTTTESWGVGAQNNASLF